MGGFLHPKHTTGCQISTLKEEEKKKFDEFYKNRLLCEIYICTVVKTIVFESISRSELPNNSKFSEGRMFSSCNSVRKRLFRWRVYFGHLNK